MTLQNYNNDGAVALLPMGLNVGGRFSLIGKNGKRRTRPERAIYCLSIFF